MTKLVTGLAFDIGQRDIYEDRVAVRRLTTRSKLDCLLYTSRCV